MTASMVTDFRRCAGRFIPKKRRSVFRADDYGSLERRYFSDLRRPGAARLDPSGWLETRSDALPLLPPVRSTRHDAAHYWIDYGDALAPLKEILLTLIEEWESRPVAQDEVSLCHSVSCGSIAVLNILRDAGVRNVLFETPAYGVTVEQARSLGMNPILIPSFRAQEFRCAPADFVHPKRQPHAVWLTQPRISLGLDQSLGFVRDLSLAMTPHDFLVIDEATEQRFPSHLRSIRTAPGGAAIVKIRGFFKPAGLNGVRLAFVLHDSALRKRMQDAVELAAGSLDAHSLQVALAVTRRPHLFRLMLAAANDQTVALRKRVDRIAIGGDARATALVNGYVGSLLLTLGTQTHRAFVHRRKELLAYCRDHRMPILTGATMLFAWEPGWEAIRLNYLKPRGEILAATELLINWAATS